MTVACFLVAEHRADLYLAPALAPPGAPPSVRVLHGAFRHPQGQKNLLMKLKIVYEVAGAKMQEMASVNSFPAGY